MADIVSPDYITIDGVSSEEVGLYIDTPPMPPMAEQQFNFYTTQSAGETTAYATDFYNDVTITIDAYVFDGGANPSSIYGYLNSGTKLITSKSADYYYKIKKLSGVIPSHSIAGKYKLTIQFTCSPFRYSVKNDLITVNNGDTIVNEGNVFSRPLWILLGLGEDFRLTVGAQMLRITGCSGKDLTVDTELMSVYEGGDHQSGQTSQWLNNTFGDLPLLGVGNNPVSWTGDVKEVRIYKNERNV